jgi:ATP-binding cassette subfamily A (ABC1) protein 3
VESYVVTKHHEENGGSMAVIVVRKMSPSEGMEVVLRTNGTGVAWTTQVISEFFTGGLSTSKNLPQSYDFSGFMSIQHMVESYYATEIQGVPAAPPPLFVPMSFAAYREWIFLAVAAQQGYISLYMVLGFLYPTSQLVKLVVKEKESRIREAMLIMGLGTKTFYMSWFATYVIMYTITSFLVSFIMVGTFYADNDFGAIFFTIWLFSLSAIALAGLLSTFFSKSRIAAMVSPIIFFILSIPLFLIANMSAGSRGILLLLSPCALAEGYNLLSKHQQQDGMSSAEVFSTRDDINLITVFIMLIVDTVLYVLLALYLDAVFPSEWGTRKHPCFCILDPIAWCKRRRGQNKGAPPEDGRDPNGVYESESASTNPVRVETLGMIKRFQRGDETFTAVDRLQLRLRENEVSVLLAHNGAGKTTAINLLTGMLDIDEGDAIVYGKSVTNDNSAVRQMIGFCPQHNILWPELTCAQHLRYYGALKGVPSDELEGSVDDMLKSVDLLDKKQYLSDKLSGGQKRKLSVAIAFIGGSKLVILDEPTAGMDVAARRHTWDLIKRMSPGRCVLLTTHYMDEADLLGHRISIMDKGRLRCEGSSMFLKSKYSVGYTVTLSVEHGTPVGPIESLFKRHIRESERQATGGEEMAFRVPMLDESHGERFPELLADIETQREVLGIRSFGIAVTTLEDVFLHIVETSALSEAAQKEKEKEQLQPRAVEAQEMSDRQSNNEHDTPPVVRPRRR